MKTKIVLTFVLSVMPLTANADTYCQCINSTGNIVNRIISGFCQPNPYATIEVAINHLTNIFEALSSLQR